MTLSLDREKLKFIALATGSAVIAAAAVRNALRAGWRAVADDDPPLNPASLETDWDEALAWTVMTGVAAGLARLVARRGAAHLWRSVKGFPPLGMNEG